MYIDPDVLQLKAHLNDIERNFLTSGQIRLPERGLDRRVQPILAICVAVITGAAVTLGGFV